MNLVDVETIMLHMICTSSHIHRILIEYRPGITCDDNVLRAGSRKIDDVIIPEEYIFPETDFRDGLAEVISLEQDDRTECRQLGCLCAMLHSLFTNVRRTRYSRN